MAAAKPLVTGCNVPVQELLTHKQSVFLCERANPQSLADAILTLKNDESLRQNIARGGYEKFKEHCTCENLGKEFCAILKEMLLDVQV
jgi:glycosyltransferase involved in cell wall biosynthesis